MDEPLYGDSAPIQEEILAKSEAATDKNPEDGEVKSLDYPSSPSFAEILEKATPLL